LRLITYILSLSLSLSVGFSQVPSYSDSGVFDLASVFADTGPTLLDGEMVRHLQTQKPIFLLFDTLEYNGVNVMELVRVFAMFWAQQYLAL
jgi:hypothetical protein